jgi:hypothetical protein
LLWIIPLANPSLCGRNIEMSAFVMRIRSGNALVLLCVLLSCVIALGSARPLDQGYVCVY